MSWPARPVRPSHAVAVRLQETGEKVDFLAVLDGLPAAAGQRGPGYTHDDPRVWPAIVEPVGHDPADPGSPLAGLGADGLTSLARVFADLSNLRGSYSSGVFDGEMLFFAATAGRAERTGSGLWSPYVSGDVELREIDCAHGAMTQPGPLREIGRIVAERLNELPQ
ncbi:hypothetical protein [Streptomyces marianii]|nr:hypothetical protein [Streptomyces marianii]